MGEWYDIAVNTATLAFVGIVIVDLIYIKIDRRKHSARNVK